MKNLKKIVLLALLALFASCATNNSVVSNGLIQKRKYRKGFYIDKKVDKGFDKKVKVEDEVAELEKTDKKDEQKPSIGAEQLADKTDQSIDFQEELVDQNVNTKLDELEPSNSEAFANKGAQKKYLKVFKAEVKDIRKDAKHRSVNDNHSKIKSRSNAASESGPMLVLLVLLCIFLPPVAIAIYSGITSWFWIDLLLVLLAFGVLFLPFLGGAWLAAVIIAFLVIFDVI